MDLVAEKTVNEYFEIFKQSLFSNKLFNEFLDIVDKCNFKIKIELHREKVWFRYYYFISAFAYNSNDDIVSIPEDSKYYDDLGTCGGSECIIMCNKRGKVLKTFALTEEFYDDITLSCVYLKELYKNLS